MGFGVWGVGFTAAAGRFEPPAKSEKAPAGAGRMLLDGLILILFVCLFVWVWFVWVEGCGRNLRAASGEGLSKRSSATTVTLKGTPATFESTEGSSTLGLGVRC